MWTKTFCSDCPSSAEPLHLRFDYSSVHRNSPSRDDLLIMIQDRGGEIGHGDCSVKSKFDANQEENMLEDRLMIKVVPERRRWTVGKVSVVLLALFSLTDLVMHLVDAQMDSLEAQDHYDALSADVIRPAFRYNDAVGTKGNRRTRMGLGSAAISSVTTTLSPILPFTGGLDLRKEDYWKNGIGSFTSVIEQVRDAFAQNSGMPASSPVLLVPRGGARVAQKSSKAKNKRLHTTSLSAPDPFISLKNISELSLKDMSLAFRYAVESTRREFNPNRLLPKNAPRIRNALEKMSEAVSASRGKGVDAAKTEDWLVSGDIDALNFCAAMRIFAEWRVLRQVPEGYKGYAVGISLGQKDIVQNVGKIEQAVHQWIDYQAESMADSLPGQDSNKKFSPTLRDLLQFELDMGTHDKLPRLREKTAAMGLLWVRRQLHYQTALFTNVMQIPSRFDSASAAVTAAYNEVYDRYHGWAVQKIFNYSFQAAPDTAEVYKVMNPEKLKEVTETARTRMLASTEFPTRGSHQNESGLNPFEKLGRHIGREWEKIAGAIAPIFGQHGNGRKFGQMRGGSDSPDGALEAEIETYIKEQMKIDAYEHIEAYLTVAEPILSDLAQLFDEFNMDDPTKV